MVLQTVVWVFAAIAAVLIGHEIGKRLFGVRKNVSGVKRAAQALAISLRDAGLKRLPAILEEFVIGDTADLLASVEEMATVIKGGNDVILRELEDTFERMLGVKLNSPEGREMIRNRLAAAESVAKAAAPLIVKAAIVAAI